MTKISVSMFLLIGTVVVLAASLTAQPKVGEWKEHPISYQDPKHKNILIAQYRIERMKVGCRLTIRLTNRSGRTLSHYWFAFKFKESQQHENAITDQPDRESLEMMYESCGIKQIVISEIE